MKTSLYNQKAEVIGDIELNSKVFAVKPNSHLLAEATRISLSNSRQGTSNTKTRGEVSGGGKKPWKQKGTGRARAGSTRSPIWRKGGITFGPRANQNWELKLNKKAKKQALFMALSDKAKDNLFVVVDKIILDKNKTKEFTEVLKAFHKSIKTFGKKHLFVLPKSEPGLSRASRNIPSVTQVQASNLSIIDILKADSIITTKDSLAVIEKTFLREKSKQSI